MNLETIIGLEIHVQLKTQSKMFCGCPNAEFAEPNMAICPICLAHPGTLPSLNREAVRLAFRAAVALNCTITEEIKFDRKNYFYPDLPKGYQISQYDQPIGRDGWFEIGSLVEPRRIRIERIHMEEDAGKLTHARDGALVDFNRAGVPLVEIVTRPDLRSPAEAKEFLQELRELLRAIGVSGADMEKGHLRCDANISLRPVGDSEWYPKTELKNINSFRFVERALQYEIKRQTELWEHNEPPTETTTRGWDEAHGKTVVQRTKEGEADYRYFPEPDIPPLILNPKTGFDVAAERAALPELPQAARARLTKEYGLTLSDASMLIATAGAKKFFEQATSELQSWLVAEPGEAVAQPGQLVAKWQVQKLLAIMSDVKTNFPDLKVTPENFAELIKMIVRQQVNATNAQKVLREMVERGGDPSDILESGGLAQKVGGADLDGLAQQVINDNPELVERYKAGKTVVLQVLIGHVIKQSKGTFNPPEVKRVLEEKLNV